MSRGRTVDGPSAGESGRLTATYEGDTSAVIASGSWLSDRGVRVTAGSLHRLTAGQTVVPALEGTAVRGG